LQGAQNRAVYISTLLEEVISGVFSTFAAFAINPDRIKVRNKIYFIVFSFL
jgi:hypothetical protein